MNESFDPEHPFTYRPIGIVRSPFRDPVGMPIQPAGARGIQGTVELLEEYRDGLFDIEHFSHLIVLYALHKCQGFSLRVTPFLDTREHGIFATRSPKRPNAIGLSVVRLQRVDGNRIHIEDVDILDGTPVLDIKPYVPLFDACPDAQAGWFTGCETRVPDTRSDDRFHRETR